MSDVKKFERGITLLPVSADPSNPVTGQLQISDGTARAAGMWRYDGTAWQVIGSGGGGLDSFHTETFETTSSSDFTTGNNAAPDAAGTGTLDGTLGDETSSPISSTSSLKYTMGSTSANDFFIIDTDIAVDPKQVSNFMKAPFYYDYDGDTGDIKFLVLDQDDTVITSSLDLLEASSTSKRYETSFFVPAGTTGLRYGFQVVTGNSGKILKVDDIELSTKPFFNANLTDTEYSNATLQANFWDATGSTDDFDISLVSNSDNSLFIIEDSGGLTRIRAKKNITLTANIFGLSGTGTGVYIRDSSANIISVQEITTASLAAGTTVTLDLVADDYIYGQVTNAYNRSGGIAIHATAQVEHIITPAKSNMTDWTSFTPVASWGTTNVAHTGMWRRVGDSMEIQYKSALTGAPISFTLDYNMPTGYSIDNDKLLETGVRMVVGDTLIADVGSSVYYTGTPVLNASDGFSIYWQNGTTSATITDTSPITFANTDTITTIVKVPISGWSSDVTFLAAVPLNDWQHKYLTSNATANGVMSDLTFNNLVIGNTYKINGQFFVESTNNDYCVIGIYAKDGSTIISDAYQIERTTTAWGSGAHMAINRTFVATATTLTFEVHSLNTTRIKGSSNDYQTHVTLEELSYHRLTTRFT